MNEYLCIAPDVKLGKNVKLSKFINLYGCEIGDNTKIGAFVEIQKNAKIGNNCKISSHTFICEGVTIEDNVFVGHGVMFINDTYPRATTRGGELQTEKDWKWSPLWSREAPRSGLGQRSFAMSRSARTPSWAPAASSRRTFRTDSIVAGNPARVLRMHRRCVRRQRMNDTTIRFRFWTW